MTEWPELAAQLAATNVCKCGRAYDATPTGRLWHRQVHQHTPTPDTREEAD